MEREGLSAVTPIEVRRLGGADVELYRGLRLESLRESPEAFGATLESALARPESWWRKSVKNDFILGAFLSGALAGMVRISRKEGPKDRHKAGLTGFYVRVQARRSGVARALLRAAEAHAGVFAEQLLLDVAASNRAAHALYASCGFAEYGRAPKALKYDGRYEDEILMVKFLAASAPKG